MKPITQVSHISRHGKILLVGCLLFCFWSTEGRAADWPQWRGPNRDGCSPDVPTTLPQKKRLWQQPIKGDSHAGVVVAGGSVLVHGHGPGEDILYCFSADKGELIWSIADKNKAERQYGSGPRATPLVYQNCVYTLSGFGELRCVDLARGNVLWKQKAMLRNEEKVTPYGHCASPLIADGKLIVTLMTSQAGIAALDPKTGRTIWQTPGAGQAHASFITANLGGVMQIAGYDGPDLAGWELASGKKLWTVKPDNAGDYNVGTPINVGGKLLVATDNNFTRLFAFAKGGIIQDEPEVKNDDLAPGTATPVHYKDWIFGSGNDFVCLNAKTLRTLWLESRESAVLGFTTVIAGNDRLLVLNEEGTLSLLTAGAARFELRGKMKVCDKTWAHPALANGRLFVHDAKNLYCYELK